MRLLVLFACAIRLAVCADFPLGIEYSHQVGAGVLTGSAVIGMDVDTAGFLYILASGDASKLPATTNLGAASGPVQFVMKLAPDTGKVAYLTVLDKTAHTITVDPAGSAYLAGQTDVYKLNPSGTALTYSTTIGSGVYVAAVAVDAAGHAYATGWTGVGGLSTTPGAYQTSASNTAHSYVVKLSPEGSVEYATFVAGSSLDFAYGIAVDSSTEVVIRGRTQSPDFPVTAGAYKTSDPTISAGVPFVARISADGARLVYATFTGGPIETAASVAVDSAGNTIVAEQTPGAGISVLRLDSHGALVSRSSTLGIVNLSQSSEALRADSAGRAYFTGLVSSANFPAKDSLAICGSTVLTVFDIAGELLQSTYVGGAIGMFLPAPVMAVAADGSVYVGTANDLSDPLTAVKLSKSVAAQPVRLACIGNAASWDPGPVAPGEIVSLFGQGLGPAQAAQPEVTSNAGFPSKLANVQVTFDGIPSPLLYVQEAQINAIVPWKLSVSQSTNICVTYNGGAPACLSRTVAVAAPGVFTVDGTHAAAVNQDGTINSAVNPAKAGTTVSIFATGLGPLSPSPVDGAILDSPLPSNTLPITPYQIMGSAIAFQYVGVPVQYAGPAPQEVAGVSQINFPVSGATMVVGVGPQLLVTNEVWSRSFSLWVSPK
jgi:uncharacterized protein (TIGR03437 family)